MFNINTGESATFTGLGGIDNVLGRVTGGSQSTIDGLLASEIPGADLYLINPSGIMFGENAQLAVDGSFHTSTADYVRLGQDGIFSATDPQASTLTVAPPAAFGFLDNTVAPILVDAGTADAPLAVPSGETFSLTGGDIRVTGGVISAPGGRINLASVASPGEVNVAAGDLQVGSFATLGDISLSQGALVSANGEGGGRIVIRGGNLTVDNSLIVANTVGSLNGRGINISLTDNLAISNDRGIQANTSGTGNAGNIMSGRKRDANRRRSSKYRDHIHGRCRRIDNSCHRHCFYLRNPPGWHPKRSFQR